MGRFRRSSPSVGLGWKMVGCLVSGSSREGKKGKVGIGWGQRVVNSGGFLDVLLLRMVSKFTMEVCWDHRILELLHVTTMFQNAREDVTWGI